MFQSRLFAPSISKYDMARRRIRRILYQHKYHTSYEETLVTAIMPFEDLIKMLHGLGIRNNEFFIDTYDGHMTYAVFIYNPEKKQYERIQKLFFDNDEPILPFPKNDSTKNNLRINIHGVIYEGNHPKKQYVTIYKKI